MTNSYIYTVKKEWVIYKSFIGFLSIANYKSLDVQFNRWNQLQPPVHCNLQLEVLQQNMYDTSFLEEGYFIRHS